MSLAEKSPAELATLRSTLVAKTPRMRINIEKYTDGRITLVQPICDPHKPAILFHFREVGKNEEGTPCLIGPTMTQRFQLGKSIGETPNRINRATIIALCGTIKDAFTKSDNFIGKSVRFALESTVIIEGRELKNYRLIPEVLGLTDEQFATLIPELMD